MNDDDKDYAYKCMICNQRFQYLSQLSLHDELDHSEEKQFKCKKCSITFTNAVYLKNHEETHFEPWI